MMPEQKTPYADILMLPHHKVANRPHMSMHDLAAQFSPFAALTGFDGVIAETGRMTDQKAELSEGQMTLLNQKLNLIDDAVQDGYHPMVTVVYFVPDAKKDGGSYQGYTGKVRQVDAVERKLVSMSGVSSVMLSVMPSSSTMVMPTINVISPKPYTVMTGSE